MSCFFSSEDVIQLHETKADVRLKFEKLRDGYAARTYQTTRGREYAFTGLLRRLDLMIRTVDWVFQHVSEFRDSLAHRIPLYIPPFILSREHSTEYHRLEKAAFDAGQKGDYKAYEDLKAQQLKLGVYRPWMTHSPTEGSPAAVFHQQLLQDFLTIDECASKILDELSLFDKRQEEGKRVYSFYACLRRWLCRTTKSLDNTT
jgi:hypothetical protein